jgi:hypothetical protein
LIVFCCSGGSSKLPLVLTAVAALLFAGHAHAYRTIADSLDFAGSEPIRWRDGVYVFDVYDSVPESLPIGSLASAAERGFAAWSAVACSAVYVSYAGLTTSPAELGDGRNTVEVIQSGWEDLGYAPEAAGATALEFEETADGWEIVEADIRLNAEHHEWSLSDAPSDGRRSLLGTLRHEAGHALGLLHPCEADGEDGAPRCDASYARDAIMYPFYEPGQTELTPDDSAGICALYPRCEIEGCEPGFACVEGACLAECGDSACQRDEVCFQDACLTQEECEQAGCFVRPPSWVIGCEPTSDCPDGACLSDGSCAQQCGADSDCSERRRCVFDEDPNVPGYCGLKAPKSLGEACSTAAECEDGECVAGAERKPVCTRACSGAAPKCPGGWSCSGVEGRSVCIPPRAPRGCALSLRASTTPIGRELPWLAPFALAFAAALRRHIRRSPFEVRSIRS